MKRPEDLNRAQGILLSRDFDDKEPFLRRITVSHLFEAHTENQFVTFADAIKVARSLADKGVDVGDILSLDNSVIARFESIPMTDTTEPFVQRFFHALDHCRPAFVWDLALMADAAKIEPQALRPILDILEHCGGDAARCHQFLAYCAEG
jgi:hypothetical protein